jgi:Transmembrane secretion effector
MADPFSAAPEEARVDALPPQRSAFELLRRRDFRRVYIAVSASELGDALQYIALMWFAFEAGGPLGVLAVRLADSVPALVFGLHGGLVADRWDRRRVLVTSDLVRAAILVPVAAAGLTGELPLWGLVVAAFILTSATSYFDPAYGALLPSLVDRPNVQQANGLVRATAEALSVGGWAVAAGLLAFLPVSAFFALNAATFLVSAIILATVRSAAERRADPDTGSLADIAAGFQTLRARPFLAAAVVALGLAVTIAAGTWIAGTPQLVSENLDRAAGGFSLVMTGYTIGAISAGPSWPGTPSDARRSRACSRGASTCRPTSCSGSPARCRSRWPGRSSLLWARAPQSCSSTRPRRSRSLTACSAESWASSPSSTAARTRRAS